MLYPLRLVDGRPPNHRNRLFYPYWCEVTLDTEPQPATPLPSDSHTDWSTIPDFQLIEACLGGEEAAWSALLARYGRFSFSHLDKGDYALVVALPSHDIVIHLDSLTQTE